MSLRPHSGFTVLEFLAVLGMAMALVSIGWPRWWEGPWKARSRETRDALRRIQTALERYAVDHGGCYPDFLYGGDFTDDFASSDAPVRSTFGGDVDALLEYGYLATYPVNPFVAGPMGLLRPKRVFEPRDWELPRDPGRVGWYADGGDRALHLATRRVGGNHGTAMADLTEGQRHAPPVWAVPARTQTNGLVRLGTPWRGVAAGNFVYHARYPAGAGYRWKPGAEGTRHPKAMGYALWAYGPPVGLGLDVCTEYGIPADPWLEPGPTWRPNGPDSNPDGALMLLTNVSDRPGANH